MTNYSNSSNLSDALTPREFFVKVERTHKERILKDQFIPPYSLYLYSKQNQSSYFMHMHLLFYPHADKLIENMINDIPHDYCVVIRKKWRVLTHPIVSEMIQNSEHEEILPDKKKEILVLTGISNDWQDSFISAYYIERNDRTSIVALTDLQQIPISMVWDSALLHKNKRPMFYSSKGEFPIPIPDDVPGNIMSPGYSYNFQKAVLPIHTSISKLIKNLTHWKIVDIDGCTELSVEELFDKYYSSYDLRYKIPDFGNCKRCNQPLKPPFYKFYPNDITREYYKTGPINSLDELWRYEWVADRKWKEVLPYPFSWRSEDRDRLPSNRAEALCPACQNGWLRFVNVTRLHLTPDSTNIDLDQYKAGLVDMNDYPIPMSFDEGFFGLGDSYYYELKDDLDLAFAKDDATLAEYQQKELNNLLNNFIKEKGRRYPNEEELTQWLNSELNFEYISHCKIFDMRGLNYFQYESLIRFVVIVHLTEKLGLWHSKPLWVDLLISEERRYE